MRTRRGFLASLVALAVAPFAKPTPRFQGWDSKWFLTNGPRKVIYIPQRKIMARIRVTKEVLDGLHKNAFSDFMQEDLRLVARGIVRAEKRYL